MTARRIRLGMITFSIRTQNIATLNLKTIRTMPPSIGPLGQMTLTFVITNEYILTLGLMIISITILGLMTLRTMTLSITKVNIMALSITTLGIK
jgi:hypothetical protein